MRERPDRFCVLADSLSGAVRWRFSDYEQLLTKQLKLLATLPLRDLAPELPAARDERP
jgi:hypothetical protein